MSLRGPVITLKDEGRSPELGREGCLMFDIFGSQSSFSGVWGYKFRVLVGDFNFLGGGGA